MDNLGFEGQEIEEPGVKPCPSTNHHIVIGVKTSPHSHDLGAGVKGCPTTNNDLEGVVKPWSSTNNNLGTGSSLDPEPGLGVRALRFIKLLVIEPVIFTHLCVLLMTHLTAEDLLLDRACRVNLNYSDTVCSSLTARQVLNYSSEETEVQKVISVIATWRSALEYSVPSVLVLLLGSWSDRWGRRFPVLLPQIGTVLKAGGLLVSTYFGDWDANLVAVIYSVPSTFTGGYPLFSMAYHSVIGDSTGEKYRTARFGLANGFSSLGVSTGSAIGGALLSRTGIGHAGVFQISVVLEIGLIAYTLVFVRNEKPLDLESKASGSKIVGPPAPNPKLCSVQSLWSPFGLLFRTRGRRWRLCLVSLCYFLAAAPFYGEPVVLYLFTRLRLGWDAGGFGLFSMIRVISQAGGVLFAMGILSSWLQVRDPVLGVLASLSQLSSCFIYAFAGTNALMYTGAAVDVLNGAMTVVARSMGSKLVSQAEQGRLHSLFAVSDTLNPILSNLAYGSLYRATLETLPGGFFLLSAASTVPPLAIFLYFMYAKL